MPCSPLTEWMRAPTPTTEASTSTRPTTSSEGRGRQGRGAMRAAVRPRDVSVRGVGSIDIYPAVITLAICFTVICSVTVHPGTRPRGPPAPPALVEVQAASYQTVAESVYVPVVVYVYVQASAGGAVPYEEEYGTPAKVQVRLPPSPVVQTTSAGSAVTFADTAPGPVPAVAVVSIGL